MRRLSLVVFLGVVAAALLVAQPSAAQGTLAGETFVGDPVLTDVTCNVGGTSTFRFSSEGVATGPVTGTYRETGTARIGPQEVAPSFAFIVGEVLEVQAQFEIRSVSDDVLVTGHKRLTEPLPVATTTAAGACFTAAGETDPFTYLAAANVCYRAQFSGSGDTEEGTSVLSIEHGPTGGGELSLFLEDFFPSETITCEPSQPESKDECKKGGAFDNSPVFKNQGDCVSFVATKGKNEPAAP